MAKTTKKLARPSVIQARVSHEERQAFEFAAELAGISLSDWVRLELRRASERSLTRRGYPVAFFPPRKPSS